MLNPLNKFFRKFNIYLYCINDIRDIDTIGVLQKIKINTQFSFSYIILLTSSTLVTTLGLLLNSAPVVIGGMLISPLMWPLMKISVGVSYERKSYIIQALHLLAFSVILSFVSSIFITTASPLKIVTTEILARTTPTLLDIFVAISAGAIAAFAIVQKKISDSLAGVAIATSLMPPLCVSGIGLALQDYVIAGGGFLLFFTNVISIVFVSVFIFTFVGIKRKSEEPLRKKSIIFIVGILFLTSLPLLFMLQNYSFQIKAFQGSKMMIESELAKVSQDIYVENVKVETNKSRRDTVFISADVISPESIQLDYSKKTEIVEALEKLLNKEVDLNLRIQRTVTLRSDADIKNGNIKKQIAEFMEKELTKYNGSLVISTIESTEQGDQWNVLVVAHANPTIIFTEKERQTMQEGLQKMLHKNVLLNINLIPLLTLQVQSNQNVKLIKNDIENYILENLPEVNITALTINEQESTGIDGSVNSQQASYKSTIRLETPSVIDDETLNNLKDYLQDKYKSDFLLKIISVETKTVDL